MSKIVSIDIGSKNIKIVEGSSEKNNLIVKKAVTVKTPTNALAEGYINDYESIKTTLRQVLTSNSIKAKSAVFNINTTSMITRTVELPIVKKHEETIQMIRFELEQFLPVVLDEYKIVFRVINTYIEDGVKKGSYLIYAVPTRLINDYRKLASDLGLKLISMDLSFNSIEKVFTVGRNISGTKLEKDKAYYVLELGHKSLIFSVMQNSKNVFTRIINLGGADIDVSIENMFEVNSENASKIKHKFSNLDITELQTEEETNVNNIITANLTGWINEIRRVMQYFTSRNKDIDIECMFIFGGSAQIKSIDKYFKDSLGIDTIIVNDISGFTFDTASKLMSEFRMSEYLDAASGLLKSKSEMNLLSDLVKTKQSRLKNIFTGTLAFGLLAMAILFYFINYSLTIHGLNNEMKYYDSIINSEAYQAKYKEVLALENKINVLKGYKGIVSTLNTTMNKSDVVQTDLLTAISSTIPIDTNISSMSISGSNISIQGTSILRESVAQLIKNLKELEYIEKVHTPSISSGGAEYLTEYSFTVNITAKEVE
jgi:type IV pilus assembly protein PilM